MLNVITGQFELERIEKRKIGLRIRCMLWHIAYLLLFRYSLRPMYSWRRAVLGLFGAQLARDARIKRTARIECPWNLRIGANSYIGDDVYLYNLASIEIGSDVTISQRAFLCDSSHDYTKSDFRLITGNISIKNNVWIAVDAFIGPGVSIDDNVVIGARSVVTKDMQAGKVCAGNPCRPIKNRVIEDKNE